MVGLIQMKERIESDVKSYMHFLANRIKMLETKQNETKELKEFDQLLIEITAYSECLNVFAAMVGLTYEIRNLLKS